jgi:hypothetical protein
MTKHFVSCLVWDDHHQPSSLSHRELGSFGCITRTGQLSEVPSAASFLSFPWTGHSLEPSYYITLTLSDSHRRTRLPIDSGFLEVDITTMDCDSSVKKPNPIPKHEMSSSYAVA